MTQFFEHVRRHQGRRRWRRSSNVQHWLVQQMYQWSRYGSEEAVTVDAPMHTMVSTTMRSKRQQKGDKPDNVRPAVKPTTSWLQVRRPKYRHGVDIYDKQNRQQGGEKYPHIAGKTKPNLVTMWQQKATSMRILTTKLAKTVAEGKQKRRQTLTCRQQTVEKTSDREATKGWQIWQRTTSSQAQVRRRKYCHNVNIYDKQELSTKCWKVPPYSRSNCSENGDKTVTKKRQTWTFRRQTGKNRWQRQQKSDKPRNERPVVEPTTSWLQVQRPNYSHNVDIWQAKTINKAVKSIII